MMLYLLENCQQPFRSFYKVSVNAQTRHSTTLDVPHGLQTFSNSRRTLASQYFRHQATVWWNSPPHSKKLPSYSDIFFMSY